MYVPGTSGAPESVNGSRYTVCAAGSEGESNGADVVKLTNLLARDCIGAVSWLVNNGKRCNRYSAA